MHPHLPADLREVPDLLARRSLPSAWVENWTAAPQRQVIRTPDGRWLTGADLLAQSASVAARLRGAGVRPGDRVVMSAAASGELVVAHVAVLRLGAVVVPMNTSYTPREILHIVGDATPAAAIVDRPEVAAAIREANPQIVVVSPDVSLPDGENGPLDQSASGDPAMIGYTSGTTGAPKGAVLSHGNLLASAEALRIAWRWTPEDRLYLCLPLFHMHGLGVGIHGTLLAGASAVLATSFDAEVLLSTVADPAEGITLFFGVPTMYARLVAANAPERLARLRLLVSGSAPLAAEFHQQMERLTGQRVLERYGMTETVMLVSNPYDGERRAGTVGFPLPGVEVRLGDRDEIQVRGPNVFAGYWNRPEATADAFTADGWFCTGDVGEYDGEYLKIVGRTKELIISGGFNVYPREIEDVLLTHTSVGEVAVAGTPSAEWGEVVTAYVVPAPGQTVDPTELLTWARTQLAAFKCPRIVHVIDTMPRNALGKIVRHELKPLGAS